VKEQVEPVILDKSTTKEEKERFDIEWFFIDLHKCVKKYLGMIRGVVLTPVTIFA
jgi:hypothetical protein